MAKRAKQKFHAGQIVMDRGGMLPRRILCAATTGSYYCVPLRKDGSNVFDEKSLRPLNAKEAGRP